MQAVVSTLCGAHSPGLQASRPQDPLTSPICGPGAPASPQLVQSLRRIPLCNPVDCSLQAPVSMGYSRQEHWSVLPFPTPGDLPSAEIKPMSPALAGGFFTPDSV